MNKIKMMMKSKNNKKLMVSRVLNYIKNKNNYHKILLKHKNKCIINDIYRMQKIIKTKIMMI